MKGGISASRVLGREMLGKQAKRRQGRLHRDTQSVHLEKKEVRRTEKREQEMDQQRCLCECVRAAAGE